MSNRILRKRKAESSFHLEEDQSESKRSKKVCCFCLSSDQDELQLGELFTKEDITCHEYCLFLSSGLCQNGRTNERLSIKGFLLTDIRAEIKRGIRLRCHYCHKTGATLGCCAKRCRKAFHLPCGRANGTLHQFFGGFKSFCDEHCPRQSFSKKPSSDISCSICLSPLNPKPSSVHILQGLCCNNAWFHTNCLQQYAMSAGKHHFRCPLCNCSKTFIEEMQMFGIYVPDQDASWERQNGAYDELLERHSTCDAEVCSCPMGRNHDAESGKYDLLLCTSCGSFGSHRVCRGLVWKHSSLVCPVCVLAPTESNKKSPNHAVTKKGKASHSGCSDQRVTNSQLEGAKAIPSSSSSEEEEIVHLEVDDTDDYVDVEDEESDNHLHFQTYPVLIRHLNVKNWKEFQGLPLCFIRLERIDKIVPLSQKFINLNGMSKFSYDHFTGRVEKVNSKLKGISVIKTEKKKGTKNNNHKTNGPYHNSRISLKLKTVNCKEVTAISWRGGKEGKQENSGQKENKSKPVKKAFKGRKGYRIRRSILGETDSTCKMLRNSGGSLCEMRLSPVSAMKKEKMRKFLLKFNSSAYVKEKQKKRCQSLISKKKINYGFFQSRLNFRLSNSLGASSPRDTVSISKPFTKISLFTQLKGLRLVIRDDICIV